MNKLHFLIFYSLFSALSILAQENPNSPQIQTSMKVKLLMDKKASYNRLSNGEYDGYRIKIHFGSDRVKAREIRSKFMAKYNGVDAYEDYQQPNFVITVGDYRTRLEAVEALKKILVDFPNGFIVKSKIKPMKVG